MTAWIRSCARFWYGFVVGDDWRIAAGVAAGLGVTYGVSRLGAPAWWCMPLAAGLVLSVSLWRDTRGRART